MKLTVAVIAYGRYKYLDEAVASIARQTRPPDEVIVFTDNKGAVKPFFEKYGVQAEIFHEPELTLPATYARIGEIASGHYILPLEDDDVFKPEKLEVVEQILKERRYPLVKHATDFIDVWTKPTTWIQQPEEPVVMTRENAWQLYSRFPYHVWPSTFAIKIELLKKYGEVLKRLLLHADFAIYVLALRDGGVLYRPEKLTYYRVGSGHSQLTTCSDLPKLVCTWNKYTYDDKLLLSYMGDDSLLAKIVLSTYIYHAIRIYLFNKSHMCNYKYDITYRDLLLSTFEAWRLGASSLKRRVLLTLGVMSIPILGKSVISRLYIECRGRSM